MEVLDIFFHLLKKKLTFLNYWISQPCYGAHPYAAEKKNDIALTMWIDFIFF